MVEKKETTKKATTKKTTTKKATTKTTKKATTKKTTTKTTKKATTKKTTNKTNNNKTNNNKANNNKTNNNKTNNNKSNNKSNNNNKTKINKTNKTNTTKTNSNNKKNIKNNKPKRTGKKAMTVEVKVINPWYTMIEAGLKNISGFVRENDMAVIRKGDTIHWISHDDPKKSHSSKVTEVKEYKNFKELLYTEKPWNVMPGIPSVICGLKILSRIFNRNAEDKHGVVAVYFE
jgi:ASC-1-like (ASCH) protein